MEMREITEVHSVGLADFEVWHAFVNNLTLKKKYKQHLITAMSMQ